MVKLNHISYTLNQNKECIFKSVINDPDKFNQKLCNTLFYSIFHYI